MTKNKTAAKTSAITADNDFRPGILALVLIACAFIVASAMYAIDSLHKIAFIYTFTGQYPAAVLPISITALAIGTVVPLVLIGLVWLLCSPKRNMQALRLLTAVAAVIPIQIAINLLGILIFCLIEYLPPTFSSKTDILAFLYMVYFICVLPLQYKICFKIAGNTDAVTTKLNNGLPKQYRHKPSKSVSETIQNQQEIAAGITLPALIATILILPLFIALYAYLEKLGNTFSIYLEEHLDTIIGVFVFIYIFVLLFAILYYQGRKTTKKINLKKTRNPGL